MRDVRKDIGGLGNLLFKEAFIYGQLLDGKIPDLYVQSTRYWTKHKNQIRQRFSYGIGDKTIDKVALHVRRGDYLKATQFHVNLWDTSYYTDAISLFPNDEFLVFCRDRQDSEVDRSDYKWCVENILPLLGGRGRMYDPTNSTETEDLNQMASCKGLIMANSSFSWWAAFLGNHDKVTCPREWFTDGQQRTELLPEWVLL